MKRSPSWRNPTCPTPSSVLHRGAARSPVIDTATATLIAALLGFFVITLDAVVINVALPSIRTDLGADMTNLQWVVDGYTFMDGVRTSLLIAAAGGNQQVVAPGPRPHSSESET